MLRAYFDESGTHGEAYVTSIAGYVATKEVWQAVEAGWNDVLGYYRERTPVRAFRASECLAEPGRGQFATLDQFHRLAIAKRLSEVLGGSEVWPIWCAVVVDDWQAVAPADFRQRYKKPFDLCFEHVMVQLWSWMQRQTNGEKVSPMFAHQTEYAPIMAEVEKAYRSDEGYRAVIGPIAFGWPEEVLPLQAADLMAHEASEYWRHVVYDEARLWNMGARRLMLNIIEKNGWTGRGGCYDAEGLATAIRRFRENGSAYGRLPWCAPS
jgi:hypothetical protein